MPQNIICWILINCFGPELKFNDLITEFRRSEEKQALKNLCFSNWFPRSIKILSISVVFFFWYNNFTRFLILTSGRNIFLTENCPFNFTENSENSCLLFYFRTVVMNFWKNVDYQQIPHVRFDISVTGVEAREIRSVKLIRFFNDEYKTQIGWKLARRVGGWYPSSWSNFINFRVKVR